MAEGDVLKIVTGHQEFAPESGLPAQWTATGAGQVVANADNDDEAVLTVKAPDGAELSANLVFEVQGETGLTLASVDPYGYLVLKGATVDDSNGGGALQVYGTGIGRVFSFMANNGSGVGSAEIGIATTLIGFFGATAVARPEVPAVPTEQDIVDALVLLGLVTQAP